jgi:hypothetical protein
VSLGLLITTFCSGILHNFLYGMAKNKTTLCVALMLSQLTKVNFPILSSLASKDTSTNEQERVQGAVFATKGSGSEPLSPEQLSLSVCHTVPQGRWRHINTGTTTRQDILHISVIRFTLRIRIIFVRASQCSWTSSPGGFCPLR